MTMRLSPQLWKACMPVCSTALLSFSILMVGCATEPTENEPSFFRVREARPIETIFSPLDLPAANAVRTGSGAPGHAYWQQQADYVIQAELNDETGRIQASERVTYTNNSPDDLSYIWIHLEQNIFRGDSLGSRTSGNASIAMNDSTTNGVVIETLTNGGAELQYSVYDTVARIDLDEPIAAGGGQFTFDLAWHFDMPKKAFRRFGQKKVEQGTIWEVAQWFPAVAVYDDYYGWNTLPYMGSGEFYTNFGSYDVSLTVPRSHIVAATGVLQNTAEVFTAEQQSRIAEARTSDETVVIRTAEDVGAEGDRPAGDTALTWRYLADDVRTFAWASSDAFIYDGCNLDGVFVQSVYPKEATPNWEASTQMLRTSIVGYNEQWFEYPYPEATNGHGPEGGIEYPMLIFCGARTSESGLYGVTAHEIGHNWFPMIVNTDERRHAWMDEGFNTFINYYVRERWFPGEKGRRGNAASFAEGMKRAERAPMETHADKLPRWSLGRTQYAKPAVGLVLLREQILGPERFDAAFREYIARWAFKSPRPADFFRTMEDVAGADLAWFWRGWFLETSTLDQAVGDVEQSFDEESGKWKITATLLNEDELVMPVTLEITYLDESTEVLKLPVEIWYPSDRYEMKWVADQEIMKIVIDPESVYPEMERGDNVWYK